MRLHKRFLCIAVTMFLTSPFAVGEQLNVHPNHARYDVVGGVASSNIIIRMKENAASPIAGAHADFNDACAEWGVLGIRKFADGKFEAPDIAASLGLDRTFRVSVPPGTDTREMIKSFAALSDVIEFAELDGIGGVAIEPDDADFPQQWSLQNTGQEAGTVGADVDAPGAWEIHSGDPGTVTIAIIDSGVDSHIEYDSRTVQGINTNNPDTPDLTSDGCPHGTHVAGIAGAEGNNGIGMAGMSWGAQIMPIRVLSGCNGTESQCADGIIWATDNGADICNMSLQYYNGTRTLEDAVNYAHSQGVVMIAAAGNGIGDLVAFPARFENCMAISATNRFDGMYFNSNYGDQIDFSAPGEDIYSTWSSPSDGFTLLSGTSMAAPHVAGLAALMLSLNPSLTPDEIREIMRLTTEDLGPEGWDEQFGEGRIDAAEAMAMVQDPLSVGACCDGLGGCEFGLFEECSSPSWYGGAVCDPLPCAYTPVASTLGPRYLSIAPDPSNEDLPIAIQIGSDSWPCLSKYVALIDGDTAIVDDPEFRPANSWGEVVVSAPEIYPGSEYTIAIDYGAYQSESVFTSTWKWGDVDNSNFVNFADVLLSVQVFQGDTALASLEAADGSPCRPNGLVNFDDILRNIQAFQGNAFAALNCPTPCD